MHRSAEARPWRRSAMMKLNDSTRSGLVSKTRFIAAWPISSTSVSSSATTLAVRGSPVNKAISPKKSPSLRVATVREPAVFTDLDPNPSFVDDEHRGTRIARPDHSFTGRKDVTDRRLRQHRGLVRRQAAQRYRPRRVARRSRRRRRLAAPRSCDARREACGSG